MPTKHVTRRYIVMVLDQLQRSLQFHGMKPCRSRRLACIQLQQQKPTHVWGCPGVYSYFISFSYIFSLLVEVPDLPSLMLTQPSALCQAPHGRCARGEVSWARAGRRWRCLPGHSILHRRRPPQWPAAAGARSCGPWHILYTSLTRSKKSLSLGGSVFLFLLSSPWRGSVVDLQQKKKIVFIPTSTW